MKIEIEIDENLIPEGYEFVRYGKPKCGDHFITGDPVVVLVCNADLYPPRDYPILKKKRWRAKRRGEYWSVLECTPAWCRLESS